MKSQCHNLRWPFTNFILLELKEKKMSKVKLPSPVFKDLQLATVQFCAVQLGDGILHVTARCELHHSVFQKDFD